LQLGHTMATGALCAGASRLLIDGCMQYALTQKCRTPGYAPLSKKTFFCGRLSRSNFIPAVLRFANTRDTVAMLQFR